MHEFIFLIPVSLALGLIALVAFMWTLRQQQYDDLDGAAARVLNEEDRPLSAVKEDKVIPCEEIQL